MNSKIVTGAFSGPRVGELSMDSMISFSSELPRTGDMRSRSTDRKKNDLFTIVPPETGMEQKSSKTGRDA
jgi:hypothetical protein